MLKCASLSFYDISNKAGEAKEHTESASFRFNRFFSLVTNRGHKIHALCHSCVYSHPKVHSGRKHERYIKKLQINKQSILHQETHVL